jgi:hypothetical protein
MAWGDSGFVLSGLRPEIDYLGKDSALAGWRLCTNFSSAQDILERFGEWPDNLLEPDKLDPLYKGESKDPIPGLAVAEGARVMPLFPYLDEAEAEGVVKVYEAAKTHVYPEFAAFLEKAGGEPLCGAEGMLLPAQTLLVYSMREQERETGIWDMRTPKQRLGTVFALGCHIAGTFSRVSALVAGKGMRLCIPWGGAYGEYSKILPVLENPYAGWILRTADEEMNVLLGGLVSRPLQLLELIDTSKLLLGRGQARLNVDVLPASSALPYLQALQSAMREVATGASRCMNDLLRLWRTGRYAHLEGPGDYLEMTYAVLLGLLFSWAMEDGLLRRPPEFVRSGEPLVPRKPIWATIARTKTRFSGMCMLRYADSLWDSLVGVANARVERDGV